MKPRGPDFIVFGAGKSGTTSLHRYLAQHPGIFMAQKKEPRFFALDDHGRYPDLGSNAPLRLVQDLERSSVADWDAYCQMFEGALPTQLAGEVSPLYLFTSRAPAKIHRLLPSVALIAVLRHPVDLALSAFKMNVRNGYETITRFEEAVPLRRAASREGWRWKLYIEQAMHGRNLQRFFDLFPAQQLKVFLFDDLRTDPNCVVNAIFEFLGLESGLKIDVAARHNVGLEPRFSPGLRSAARRIVPEPILAHLRNQFRGLARKGVQMPASLRSEYLPVFREDVLLLQDLLDRDLSDWLR